MIYTKKEKKQTLLASIVELIFLLGLVFLIRTFLFGLYQVPSGSMETTMLVGERFFADKLSYVFRKPRRGEIIAFNEPMFKYSTNPFMRIFQEYVWGPSNWTKRVIGIPGDVVQGVIEQGKPVVYVNGQKIQEPYLNAYPLLTMWRENPHDIRAKIDADLRHLLNRRSYDQEMLKNVLAQKEGEYTTVHSYDPSAGYDQQKFYRINPDFIYRDADGNQKLKWPGTPQSRDIFHEELGENEYWCMGDNRLGSHDCRMFGAVKEKYIHGRIVFRIWSHDSDESWWIIDLLKHPIDFWARMRWSRFFQWVN